MKNTKLIILGVAAFLTTGAAVTIGVSEPIRTGLIQTIQGTTDDTVDLVTPDNTPNNPDQDGVENPDLDSNDSTDTDKEEDSSKLGVDESADVDGKEKKAVFREDDNLRVFIPNTVGNSTLLIDGKDAMLVDTGKDTDAKAIIEMLQQQKVSHLKYLVVSNWHPETTGGLKSILSKVSAQYIILSGNILGNPKGQDIIKYLDNRRLVWSTSANSGTMDLGQSRVRVLSSNKGGSLLTHINNKSTNVAISGSTTYFEEGIFDYLPTNFDLYIATHNGPNYTVPVELVEKLNPSNIILNDDKRFNTKETVKNLSRENTKLYQLQEQGNMAVGSNGLDLNVIFNVK